MGTTKYNTQLPILHIVKEEDRPVYGEITKELLYDKHPAYKDLSDFLQIERKTISDQDIFNKILLIMCNRDTKVTMIVMHLILEFMMQTKNRVIVREAKQIGRDVGLLDDTMSAERMHDPLTRLRKLPFISSRRTRLSARYSYNLDFKIFQLLYNQEKGQNAHSSREYIY